LLSVFNSPRFNAAKRCLRLSASSSRLPKYKMHFF
jgi:hypothetical protein